MADTFPQTLMKYMAGNFTCREIARLMTEYLEGSLSISERVRFHIHLGLCFACRRYLRQVQQTITVLGQLPPDPVPPHIQDELMRRFRTWKHRSPQSPVNPELE